MNNLVGYGEARRGVVWQDAADAEHAGHNHGPWWPRENCSDRELRQTHPQGWKLAEINAAKAVVNEKATSEGV